MTHTQASCSLSCVAARAVRPPGRPHLTLALCLTLTTERNVHLHTSKSQAPQTTGAAALWAALLAAPFLLVCASRPPRHPSHTNSSAEEFLYY